MRVPCEVKIIQLTLERNYGEAIRLLQARLAQFHFDSEDDKAELSVQLALMQRLAGDTAGAKATANRRVNTLSSSTKTNQTMPYLVMALSQAYAVMGEKDLALKIAEHALMLARAKSPLAGHVAHKRIWR